MFTPPKCRARLSINTTSPRRNVQCTPRAWYFSSAAVRAAGSRASYTSLCAILPFVCGTIRVGPGVCVCVCVCVCVGSDA
jgi:hypothetical protein